MLEDIENVLGFATCMKLLKFMGMLLLSKMNMCIHIFRFVVSKSFYNDKHFIQIASFAHGDSVLLHIHNNEHLNISL